MRRNFRRFKPSIRISNGDSMQDINDRLIPASSRVGERRQGSGEGAHCSRTRGGGRRRRGRREAREGKGRQCWGFYRERTGPAHVRKGQFEEAEKREGVARAKEGHGKEKEKEKNGGKWCKGVAISYLVCRHLGIGRGFVVVLVTTKFLVEFWGWDSIWYLETDFGIF